MLGSRVKEPRGDPGLLLGVCPEGAHTQGTLGGLDALGQALLQPASDSVSANGNFCLCAGEWEGGGRYWYWALLLLFPSVLSLGRKVLTKGLGKS